MIRARRSLPVMALVALGAAALPLAGRPPAAPAAPPARAAVRPNIVFILADDLDVRLNGMEYMPLVRDLLAHQGVSFADFFVPISLCCPSRTTILTGVYAHNHRVVTNTPPEGGFGRFQELNLDRATIATALRAAGYRTALMGKYLNGYPDDKNPTYVPPGWDEWDVPADDNAYGGFDYDLNVNGKLVKYGHGADDYMTDVLSQRAQAFIRHASQPYFLYLATYAPHRPATPAPRHHRLFKNYVSPRTPSWDEADVGDKPLPFRSLQHLNAGEIAAIDAIYRARLQSLQAVDEMVEALVATLRLTGQLSHTYIVFTSDNGFHMGQHRLRPGKYTAYEEDIHVPFIVRGPGVPANRVVKDLGVSVDLAPTLAEFAGATLPGTPDGRSLVPLWSPRLPAAPAVGWRQAVLIEQRPFSAAPAPTASSTRGHAGVLEPPDMGDTDEPGKGIFPPVPYVALRTATWKYVQYESGEHEFYDLVRDPYELRNLQAKLSASFVRQAGEALQALRTCAGDGCRAAEAAPMPIPGEVIR